MRDLGPLGGIVEPEYIGDEDSSWLEPGKGYEELSWHSSYWGLTIIVQVLEHIHVIRGIVEGS